MRNTVCIFFLFSVFMLSGYANALEILAGPYLQNPSETSMTVMWITDAKCTSWLEYGTSDALDRKAFNSRHGLIDADQTLHRISIDGLSPGKEYKYKVSSKEILKFEPYKVTYGQATTSDTYNFRTLAGNKESMSFIVLNDIHQRNDILASLIKLSESKAYDLVFLNGDILGHIEDQPQIINHVLKPCSDLFAKNIPFIYVRGNHEARGKYARMLGNYLATPSGNYYYSFDHGPVHFIVMDGGEDKEDSHWAYSGLVDFDRYRDQQKIWLEKEIQSELFKKAVFRIVLMHIPPTPSKKHGGDDLYNKWGPLFDQGKIDLVISGHTHKYAVMAPEAGVRDYPIVIGGSSKKGQATVIRADVGRSKLNIVMTRDDGEVVGTYEIKR
ncbi:MAG TPA: metallophosphoesterase family protein [Phycisphaerales bacterium]|nr:metallophosphoesterase family protein [Phycisphaerales bacterium]